VKVTAKKSNKRAAFTIIELLTIMSIIVILISLLVPAMSRVRRYAQRVKQSAQFHSIGVAMDLFNAEFDEYPDSEELDTDIPAPASYCGALKLAEALVGQDLLGFHPDSLFRNSLLDSAGVDLYARIGGPQLPPENLLARRGPYLELENANAYRLKNLYGAGLTAPLDDERYVLCDVYNNVTLVPDGSDPPPANQISGKTGMPVLYYRARMSGTTHPTIYNTVTINDLTNIYDYKDNDELVQLGMPFEPGSPPIEHLMDSRGGNTRHTGPAGVVPSDAMNFYDNIFNENITALDRPYRSESYILLSAGFDGEYGTEDDVFNFEK